MTMFLAQVNNDNLDGVLIHTSVTH